MKEQLEEAYNNLKDRFKNSFIITFVLVWIVYHWELIYSVLNFDSYEFRDSKIEFIKQYLKDHNMIWWPVLIAITSMLILYCIFIFSEVIHSYYGIARNNILKKIGDSKKVIEIEKYNELGKQLERIRSRAGEFQIKESEYILSKQDLENDVSSLHNQLDQANSQLSANADAIADLGKIQEENGKNLIRITELELEKNGLTQINAEKSAQILILERLRDKYKKEKDKNSEHNAFMLWLNRNYDDAYVEWIDLSNQDRNEFLNLYKNLLELEKIFGESYWHHSKISDYNDIQSTLKFTPFPVPYFTNKDGIPLYDIQSIEKMGNDQYRIYLHKTFGKSEKITLNISSYSPTNIDGSYVSMGPLGDNIQTITFYKQ